ncbi:MAG: M1 family metallopeptidase [Lutispora sp.]|jgi:hypothetical protein
MIKLILIQLIVAFSLLTGCSMVLPQTVPAIEEKEHFNNAYNISVEYQKDYNILKCKENITYVNNQGVPVKNIVLYLYPNLYRNLSTVPAIGSPEKCYPQGFDPGFIKLTSVKIEDMELGKETIEGYDDFYIDIPLDNPIKENHSVEIEIEFLVKVPVSTTRFGQYKDITQLTYWYPILAAQEEGRWQIRNYHNIGESNYSDIADYKVVIKLPADETIASTGRIVSERESDEDGYKIIEIEAEKVRDFVWVSSPSFILEEFDVDGVIIKNYYTEKNKELGQKADEIGADVIAYFNKVFGDYPYKEFSIVETYLTGGGMEYPQLIALGQSHYKDIDKLISVIAHEGAHQWWYVTVGNDEHSSPWLDEGFANYSTQLYLAHRLGNDYRINSLMKKYESLESTDHPIEASVMNFTSWKEYNDVIYKKGALVLHRLRNAVGDENFFRIIRTYYQRYKLKNAHITDFLDVVEEVSGRNTVEKIFK